MIYPIIDNKTHALTDSYAIIDNVTRKINRIYIVQDGITRLAWGAELDVLNGDYSLLLTQTSDGWIAGTQYLNNIYIMSRNSTYTETGRDFTEIWYAGQLNNGNTNKYLFDVSKYNTLYIKGNSEYDGTVDYNGNTFCYFLDNSSTYKKLRVNIPYLFADEDTGNINNCPFDMMVDISSFNNLGLSLRIYVFEYDDDMGDDWVNSFKCTLSEFKFGNRPLATSDYYLVKNGIDVSGLGLKFYDSSSLSLNIYPADYDEDDDIDYNHESYSIINNFNTTISNVGQKYRRLNIRYTISKIYNHGLESHSPYFYINGSKVAYTYNSYTENVYVNDNEGTNTVSLDIGNYKSMNKLTYNPNYYGSYAFSITINDMWLSGEI